MANFTFDTSVPAANNNPSIDQPVMQTNNASTAGIIAVDHVGFGAANGGTHLQVSFSSNNVPVPPTSPPILFTNNDAFALPQLFYYSGDATHSSTQYTAATNGSTFLLGGIIIKWGTINAISGANTFTYAGLSPAIAAFPNNTFAVFTSVISAGSFVITALTPSGVGFSGTSNGNHSYYFLAIGN